MKKSITFSIVVTACFIAIAFMVFVALGAELRTSAMTMTFNIENVTKIEIVDGSNGNTVDIIEQDQIQRLIHTFNANEFTKSRLPADNSRWSYRLSFYHGTKVTPQINIASSDRIDFEGCFYDVKNGKIDVDYIVELLYYQLDE